MSSLDPIALVQELQQFIDRMPQLLRTSGLTAGLADDVDRLSMSDHSLFTLAVVGQMRSGKSTLINSLIGDDKAVVGTRETTATVNWIRHGTGDVTNRFRVTWNSVPARSEEFPLSEVRRWTGDSQLAQQTRYLEFFSAAEFLQRVQIVDTPGSRSVLEHHQDTLQDFLTAARRCENETNFYGGAADCLVYVLPAVARESDTALLESFANQTRVPGSSPYNSVGVLHKWEAVIESDAPWRESQRKAAGLARQFRPYLSDVILASGPLHRIASAGGIELWSRILSFSHALSPAVMGRLLLHQKYFLSHNLDQGDWAPESRQRLFHDSQLPWECFKVLLQFTQQGRFDNADDLRRAVGELAGVNRLMELLETRFFGRAKAIRAATILRKALHPCDAAIDKLRRRLVDLSDRMLDADDAIRELSNLGASAEKARAFVQATVAELMGEFGRHRRLIRDLEIAARGIRDPFLRFDRDLQAVQTLDEHPGLFVKEELTQILAVLGAYGHALSDRCGGDSSWQQDLAAIEERLSYWIGQCELSMGRKQRILEQVVERLEEVLHVAFSNMCSHA